MPPHRRSQGRVLEYLPLGLDRCEHDDHAGMVAGQGEYIKGQGGWYYYIPTPSELFPTVLPPGLTLEEVNYVRNAIATRPGTIVRPGQRFGMPPFICEFGVVEHLHERILGWILAYYYRRDGGNLALSSETAGHLLDRTPNYE